jgi:hypothetical protein
MGGFPTFLSMPLQQRQRVLVKQQFDMTFLKLA